MSVRHTTCRYCGQDIEGISPYRAGEWRDRGNNRRCPTPAGDAGLQHAPIRPSDTGPAAVPARYRPRVYTYRGPIERGARYTWHDGYSATGDDGGVCYPWLTRRECRADAKRDGYRAVFAAR